MTQKVLLWVSFIRNTHTALSPGSYSKAAFQLSGHMPITHCLTRWIIITKMSFWRTALSKVNKVSEQRSRDTNIHCLQFPACRDKDNKSYFGPLVPRSGAIEGRRLDSATLLETAALKRLSLLLLTISRAILLWKLAGCCFTMKSVN